MLTTRIFMAIGASLAGLSVVIGAFGSHALRDKLTERALSIFETGTRYQMYHALALLLVAILLHRTEVPQGTLIAAGYAFIAGSVIFSGSLYALTLTQVKWLGAVTPIGGAVLIAGWVCITVAAFNYK